MTVPILHTLHSRRKFTSFASLQYLSICKSFAPSTVYVILLHVATLSTVVLLLHATSCDSAINNTSNTAQHSQCYTSLIRPRYHPSSTSTFRKHFHDYFSRTDNFSGLLFSTASLLRTFCKHFRDWFNIESKHYFVI